MAISAVQYLKIPLFDSEVVYEAKTDKVSKLLVDKDEYPSMTKGIVFHYVGLFIHILITNPNNGFFIQANILLETIFKVRNLLLLLY